MRRRCNPRGREAQIRFSRSTSVAQLLQGLQFVVWTSDETTQIPAARSRCIKAKHNVEKGEALTIVNVELLFKTYYRHELCSAFVVRRQQGLFSSLEQGRLEPARATNGLPGLSFFFFFVCQHIQLPWYSNRHWSVTSPDFSSPGRLLVRFTVAAQPILPTVL